MRLFFSLIFLLLSATAQAQLVSDDFEGNGNISTWFGDDCTLTQPVANPFAQGLNPSANVLKYEDTGGQYANVRFQASFKFSMATHHVFTLMVYVPASGLTGSQTNQISLKLQDGSLGEPWTTQCEIIKPIVLNAWQTVTFDFKNDAYLNLNSNSLPPLQRTDFDRVVIQVNGENNNDHVLAYLDNIRNDAESAPEPVYELIWADEFEADGAINSAKWHHQTQLPAGGSWYNGEVQHYTNRTDNSVVADGVLKIIAKKEAYTSEGYTKQYTSARLNSKFAFTYGKVAVRAKLPTGEGTWPAIWMLGKNINEDGGYWDLQGYGTAFWPACGEIDIMEHWGTNQNYVQSALHTSSSSGATVNLGGQTISTASTDFHLYTLEWTAEKMVFKVDGNTHYTYSPVVKDASTWPFDAPQYLLLNVAIQPSITAGFTQSAMEIDYVRVYQQSNVAVAPSQAGATPVLYPNPVADVLKVAVSAADGQSVTLHLYAADGKLMQTSVAQVEAGAVVLTGLAALPGGMYTLAFGTNDNLTQVKFIKN